ncbi:hypothetical protein ACVIYL_000182 [Bradyrhizobium sp. USDA 3315]
MGSGGGVVEADETFIGFVESGQKKGRNAWSFKNVVFTLVERGGSARSFHIVRAGDLMPIIKENLSREAQLMTDEMYTYRYAAKSGAVASHDTVTHSKDEYFAAKPTG